MMGILLRQQSRSPMVSKLAVAPKSHQRPQCHSNAGWLDGGGARLYRNSNDKGRESLAEKIERPHLSVTVIRGSLWSPGIGLQ